MKIKTLFVLLLACLWGIGSWWWYTCKVKGFCTEESGFNAALTSLAVKAGITLPDTTQTASSLNAGQAASNTAEQTDDSETNGSANDNNVQAESLPQIPSLDDDRVTDTDQDGITDYFERKLGLDQNNEDSDGDGLTDNIEIGSDKNNPLDTDGDGVIDARDEDDDNDGDLTIDEDPDPNQDGSPSDARDSNKDGTPDYLDKNTNYGSLDDDGDGLSNGEEKKLNSNPALTDSDGDGLSDSFEAQGGKDTDGDSTPDILDPDDDDDGIMTVMENADPDGDGDPKDALDSNGNGIPDYLDTDNTPTELPDQTSKENTADREKEETKENTDDADKVTIDTSGSGNNGAIKTARLYFPFRSSEPELADSTAEYFDLIIRQLKDNPAIKIRLTGHTDSVGSGAANRRLGLKRAEQIRDILIERGAPEKQVEVASKGESEPIASNRTDAGRKKNRRVELEPIR